MNFVSAILIIVLSLIGLCRAHSGSPDDHVITMVSNLDDAINLINICDFPTRKFNATCMRAGCPQLVTSGLCPYTTDRNLNLTALNSILSILNNCFQQQKTICDTPLNNMPLPPMTIGLGTVFGNLPIGGTCTVGPNKARVINVGEMSFAVHRNHISHSIGPLKVVIDAPRIMVNGVIHCAIALPMADYILNTISSSISLGVTSTASIDFSNKLPDVRVRTDEVAINYRVENFVPNDDSAIELPAVIQDFFTSGVTSVWKNSSNPAAVANFYATFIAYGIEATKRNYCPPQ